jgi:hypothetical protein
MSRIIEADFLPQAFDEAKEKPRILIIDNNRDFTYSAKLALERTGRYSVWEENEPARAHQAQCVKSRHYLQPDEYDPDRLRSYPFYCSALIRTQPGSRAESQPNRVEDDRRWCRLGHGFT